MYYRLDSGGNAMNMEKLFRSFKSVNPEATIICSM